MAMRGRGVEKRREPVFDVAPEARADTRAERTGRRSAADGPRSPKRRADGPPPAPHRRRSRKKGGGGGGRRGRGWWQTSLLGRIIYWSVVAGVWGVVSVAAVMIWVGAHLPPIQSLEIPKRPPSVEILGINGRTIATRGEMPGAAVPLADLPPYLPKAFIAIEDRRFYSHFGIDPIGVVRALVANVVHRGVSQGGSTITQQLAKNLFLTQERTLERKIQEVVLALWLEHKLSKDEILQLYLNRMYFGAGAYGVEAAAQRYFNKSARNVSLTEAAMLAGLVKSPSRLAPTRNPDGAARRARVVLEAMVATHAISPTAAAQAMVRPVTIVPRTASAANYVADWIMDVLDDLVGRLDEDLVVETSIDPQLQATAENALADELAVKGGRYGVHQGAIVAMSPDGAVRALVGGRNYSDSQFNRAVSAKRQPGSAFKPFVYLTALERGLTPDTVREDRPISIKGWHPENYHHNYRGPVTLTEALALSLNTVSVRLTLEVGPRAVVKTAHRLGIASKLEPNASIALGTSEVSLLELTGAYAVFANGGYAVSPHVIERVRTPAGKVRYLRPRDNFGRVADPHLIGMLNTMLQQTLRSGTATHAELPGWAAAGKTGTSQDFRDAWFIGYTPHLVIGVWLGNDDGSPTKRTTGGGPPVDIWNRVMQAGHRGVPVASLPGVGRGPLLAVRWFNPAQPPRDDEPISMDRPPADVGTAPAAHAADAQSGIDGWLMGKIFGR